MKNSFAIAVVSLLAISLSASTAPAQGVKGSFLPGATSGGPISIDAGKLDYFDKDQKLVYSGGVTVRQGGSTLKASSITILLSPDALKSAGGEGAANGSGSNQIRRMEAAGPVTISSQDQVGTGDRGFFDRAENKVHLIGNVALTKDVNIQKCDELIYDLSANLARCIGNVRGLFTPGSTGLGNDQPKAAPRARTPPATSQR